MTQYGPVLFVHQYITQKIIRFELLHAAFIILSCTEMVKVQTFASNVQDAVVNLPELLCNKNANFHIFLCMKKPHILTVKLNFCKKQTNKCSSRVINHWLVIVFSVAGVR